MSLVRRRPLAGIAALGAVALIAGCGGGSDTLSADEFRTPGRRDLRRRTTAKIDDPHRAHPAVGVPAVLSRRSLPLQEAPARQARRS